jgi:16S rRNA (guanine527-N7)-methyltransferase
MDPDRITSLLQPFLVASGAPMAEQEALPTEILRSILIYIDLLLRWNARINLTAVRSPEEIVTRHFGESFFAARHLFPAGKVRDSAHHLLDLGSGAGFPGIPIKLWNPAIRLTLVESNQKKVTFLREVARALTLTNINVVAARAEDISGPQADTVTLRAVERFDQVLPVSLRLLQPAGRLALLIGSSQLTDAHKVPAVITWSPTIKIPMSSNRILLIGRRGESIS